MGEQKNNEIQNDNDEEKQDNTNNEEIKVNGNKENEVNTSNEQEIQRPRRKRACTEKMEILKAAVSPPKKKKATKSDEDKTKVGQIETESNNIIKDVANDKIKDSSEINVIKEEEKGRTRRSRTKEEKGNEKDKKNLKSKDNEKDSKKKKGKLKETIQS